MRNLEITSHGTESPNVYLGGTGEDIPIVKVGKSPKKINLWFDSVEEMEQFFEEGLDRTRGIIRERQTQEV